LVGDIQNGVNDDGEFSLWWHELSHISDASSVLGSFHFLDDQWLQFADMLDVLGLHVLTHTIGHHTEIGHVLHAWGWHAGVLLWSTEAVTVVATEASWWDSELRWGWHSSVSSRAEWNWWGVSIVVPHFVAFLLLFTEQ
jgi:hypothetical protein